MHRWTVFLRESFYAFCCCFFFNPLLQCFICSSTLHLFPLMIRVFFYIIYFILSLYKLYVCKYLEWSLNTWDCILYYLILLSTSLSYFIVYFTVLFISLSLSLVSIHAVFLFLLVWSIWNKTIFPWGLIKYSDSLYSDSYAHKKA